MEQKVDKLKDSLVFILDKLENMEKQVRKQEHEIENYIKNIMVPKNWTAKNAK
ncbi:hypothetical protein MPCS_01218 [Candidatus Megaera polyxenophila]|nr:hypothetical protein MPCS_01218 [Candidatus Megaera polyxenophila]